MADIAKHRQRITIRVGRNTLSFTQPKDEGQFDFLPYVVRSGISMAANLREAFKDDRLAEMEADRVRVMIDSDVLMVPMDLFEEGEMRTMYLHAFPAHEQDVVLHNVLPDLNAVAVFSMNKDLRTVIDDHYEDVITIAAVSPVWRHLHQRSYTGRNEKLFAYFHEQRMEVFSFRQNRFRFCNSFAATNHNDAVYYLLNVWEQLKLDPLADELHLVGDVLLSDKAIDNFDREQLLTSLRTYLARVYVISPTADFNRDAVTTIKGMPYDLQTLIVKGR